MASWRDGPEYAPLERPAAFVVPDGPPLPNPDTAAPSTPAAETLPEAEPNFTPPPVEQPVLAALVPSAAPGRNPHLPFEVVTATVTNAGGWSSGPAAAAGKQAPGHRPPELPFNAPGPSLTGYLPAPQTLQPYAQINPPPFPAPGTPQWFAPPPESRVPDAPPAVTVGQIWRASTAGVMIPLIIGIFLPWLSILMLAVSFALSARIAYRRTAIRRAYFAAMIVIGMLGLLSMTSTGYDSDVLFDSLASGAQLACLVLPVAVGLIVGGALRAGEPPDRIF